ncbi:hypothetical protein [Prosthecobacter sp.]|uniref:hypothetical protein n=1 Tax=Prosthecobacter sp. TaxID=1965333 RepID=UPI003782DD0C
MREERGRQILKEDKVLPAIWVMPLSSTSTEALKLWLLNWGRPIFLLQLALSLMA